MTVNDIVNKDGSLNYPTIGGFKDRLDGHDSSLADIAIQPKLIVPESDWTPALTRAFSQVQAGGTIRIPQGQIITFTSATISTPDVTITGGGILKGKIIVNYLGDINLRIIDLTFDTTTPIEIQQGRRITITGNTFKNCDKSIYCNPPLGVGTHTVSMVKVLHNEFLNVNYALYINHPDTTITHQSPGTLICNDFLFMGNNINVAYITHVFAVSIDGILILGNTCFFPPYTSADQNKQHNIEITIWADWVHISNNNLFESGLEAIKLGNVSHPMITSNNIAWSGQRVLSSAIKLWRDVSLDTNTFVLSAFGNISHNKFSQTTKHGVELSNVQYVEVIGNNIDYQSWNGGTYYGYDGTTATDTTAITHYGVYSENTNSGVSVGNKADNLNANTVPKNNFNPIGKYYQNITDTRTSIDMASAEYFVLQQPSLTSITAFTNGSNGQEVTFVGSNSNTTFVYSGTLVLRNQYNCTINGGETITFQCHSGVWREKSRSVRDLDAYVDITTTATTLDATNKKTLNLVQPSSTTVTAITPTGNGQPLRLLAFNGNTTLQNSSTLKLKGAVNVTIPNGGIINLYYHAGNWYESSRSF